MHRQHAQLVSFTPRYTNHSKISRTAEDLSSVMASVADALCAKGGACGRRMTMAQHKSDFQGAIWRLAIAALSLLSAFHGAVAGSETVDLDKLSKVAYCLGKNQEELDSMGSSDACKNGHDAHCEMISELAESVLQKIMSYRFYIERNKSKLDQSASTAITGAMNAGKTDSNECDTERVADPSSTIKIGNCTLQKIQNGSKHFEECYAPGPCRRQQVCLDLKLTN
jgi:hypothetical protein